MRTARQAPPGAKPNRDDREPQGSRPLRVRHPGWLLEAVGNNCPRGMAVTRAQQWPRPTEPGLQADWHFYFTTPCVWSSALKRRGARFSQWEKLSAELTDEGIGSLRTGLCRTVPPSTNTRPLIRLHPRAPSPTGRRVAQACCHLTGKGARSSQWEKLSADAD